MVFDTKKSTFSFVKTITDVAQPLVEHHIPFYEANFHVYDNDVHYGDGTVVEAIAQAGSVLYYDKGNIRDFFFKNRTAGNKGRVVVMATVPFEIVKQALGL